MNPRPLTSAVVALGLCLASSVTAAPSLEALEWRLRNPSPTGESMAHVVAGPSGFLALSITGTLFHSAHGAFWRPLAISRSHHFNAIGVYPEGYFVVSNASFLVSPDAGSWREITIPARSDGSEGFITQLVHTGDRWVALDSDRLLVSTDGTRWDAIPFTGRGGLYPFAASPAAIVAVNMRMKDPAAPPPVFPSPGMVETVLQRVSYDGVWEEIPVPGLTSLNSLTQANGRFLLTSEHLYATSTDGRVWRTQPSEMREIRQVWTGSRWAMWGSILVPGSNPPTTAGAGIVLTSTDGESWTSHPMTEMARIAGVAIGADGTWVVVGWGTPSDPEARLIATSTDGLHWQQRVSGSSPALLHITRLGGRWIAGGAASTILCSDDGRTWTRHRLDPARPDLICLELAVADGVAYAYLEGTEVYASTDGTTWAPATTYPEIRIPASRLPALVSSAGWPVWTGDRWLASGTFGTVGIGHVLRSDDGVQWTKVLTTGQIVGAVGGRPGTYLAAESGGRLHLSHDGGESWELITPFASPDVMITSIHTQDGWFIAGSTRGVYASQDGRTWTPLPDSFDQFLGGAAIDGSIWLTGDGGTLVEVTTRPSAPVANLSTRATVRADRPPVIGGFVVEGTQPVEVLVRAVGEGLRRFEVDDVVRRPTLLIFRGAIEQVRAGDWAHSPQRETIETLSTRVGAFRLAPDGGDAAVPLTVAPGAYTALITDLDDPDGDVLLEIYDADPHAAAAGGGRLVNSSTRGPAFDGHPLIGGFVVRGDRPRRILVRGIGPGLDRFGVPETADDPELMIYRGRELIAQNADWQTTTDPLAVADAFHLSGAFTLDAGSTDAAILLVLEPGEYTAHVLAARGTPPGEVLLEVYYLD